MNTTEILQRLEKKEITIEEAEKLLKAETATDELEVCQHRL